MKDIYEKRIEQISKYLRISHARNTVERAIWKLKQYQQEFQINAKLELDAPQILTKLILENEKSPLSEEAKMKLIMQEFLISQGFLQLKDMIYSLKGYEGTYLFEIRYIPGNLVMLTRHEYESRRPKGSVYCFHKFPTLDPATPEKDEKILLCILRELRRELRRAWLHLDLDSTPSISSEPTTLEDDED